MSPFFYVALFYVLLMFFFWGFALGTTAVVTKGTTETIALHRKALEEGGTFGAVIGEFVFAIFWPIFLAIKFYNLITKP